MNLEIVNYKHLLISSLYIYIYFYGSGLHILV